mgnify:CR=1 FL=1
MQLTNSNNIYRRTGWNFLPKIIDDGAHLEELTYHQDIQESLQLLFTTLPGERIAHPLYGCDLQQYVFKPINNSLLSEMENTISKAVTLFETRIDLEDVRVTIHPAYNYQLLINLIYVLRITNARYDVTLPFYTMEVNN